MSESTTQYELSPEYLALNSYTVPKFPNLNLDLLVSGVRKKQQSQEDLKYVEWTVDKKSPCATNLRDLLDFRRNLFVFLSSQRPKLVYPERLVVMFYSWIH